MPLLKKALKYTGYCLLSFMALMLLYIGCAWFFSRITIRAERNTEQEITIYLKGDNVHTDLVLPLKAAGKDWSQSFLYKNTRSRDTAFSYIAFGWGDKGFYLETPTWGDLKASTAFKAAFGLSASAIHANFYRSVPGGKHCIPLVISRNQYQRLIDYISNSLQTDSAGKAVVIATDVRYGRNDAFYEAKGRYSLFHTCNTWTNNALKACGQKACWWTPFGNGLFYQYR